jgi:hypothetical protein
VIFIVLAIIGLIALYIVCSFILGISIFLIICLFCAEKDEEED